MAKTFFVDRSIHVQFSKLIKQIPNDFQTFNLSHFTPQAKLFFVEKRTPKIFGFKNVMEREIRKILIFVIR